MLDHPLAFPKELGEPRCHATNPEQLFAAGYVCFENALMRVVREPKSLVQGSSSVTAHVRIGCEADFDFRMSVTLEVLVAGRDRSEIEDMARVAHEDVCPYSKASRGNIDMQTGLKEPASSRA